MGFVSDIYGHPVMLQLFGSPELHRKNASALLLSHGVRAAALEARGSDLGIALREGSDASQAMPQAARDMLVTLRFKSSTSRDGQSSHLSAIEGVGVAGQALWHDDRLVHVVAYPHDPRERALFARSFDAPVHRSAEGLRPARLARSPRQTLDSGHG